VWGDRSSRPAGGCASRCVGDEKHRQIDAVGERRCDREDVMSATAWGPDGRRSMIGAFSGNGGCEQSFGMRVGLRIRCAVRVRVVECRAGREVSERRGHLANVEGATAAVMRYGCQRGELFEGCECVVGKARGRPGSSDSGRGCRKHSESCSVLGRNKPRTVGWLKPSRW
jgi:hypothetical protein